MKKITYHCPFEGCNGTSSSVPGLSAHMRAHHADKWKGAVDKTLESLDLGPQALLVPAKGAEEAEPEGTEGASSAPGDAGSMTRYPRRKSQRRKPQHRKVLQRAAKRAPRGFVHYCPRCGLDLEPTSLSIGFMGFKG